MYSYFNISATVARIATAVKTRAKEDIFKPAGEIINALLLEEVTEEPLPSLPRPEYLARAANRAQQAQRPADPQDLNLAESRIPPEFVQADVRVEA